MTISSISSSPCVIKEAAFVDLKKTKLVKFVHAAIQNSKLPNFENEAAFNTFLQVVNKTEDEGFIGTTLTFLRAHRPIPDSPDILSHQIEFYSGDTLVFSCPKALLPDNDYFRALLTSGLRESRQVDGRYKLKFQESATMLEALKKYIYTKNLKGTPLSVLHELNEFFTMTGTEDGKEVVENAIINHFLDENTPFDPEYFQTNPNVFITAFFKKHNIKIELALNNSSNYRINLSDFISLFQGKDQKLLEFVRNRISSLRVDIDDISPLFLIKKEYRLLTTSLLMQIQSERELQLATQLRKFFKTSFIIAPGSGAFLQSNKTAEASLILGEMFMTSGQLDNAIKYFTETAQLDPQSHRAHERLSQCYHQKGQFDDAIRHSTKVLELEPKSWYAQETLGDCYRQKGQLDEAIAHLSTAVQLNPKSTFALDRLDECYRQKGQLDEAIEHFTTLTQLNPKSLRAHAGLGECYRQKGELDEAIAHLTIAVQLESKSRRAQAHLGDCYRQKGQLDEAIAHLSTAVQLDPKSIFAIERLGECCRQKGQLDEAIAHLGAALQLNPKSMFALECLSRCYRQKGQLDEAIVHLTTAVQLDPKSLRAHAGLGECYRQKGELDEAIAHINKILQINPESLYAKQFLEIYEKEKAALSTES